MQVFAHIIDSMKDRSPETMDQRKSDLETITTMKNVATYAGFTTAALTVAALVSTVAYPSIFGVLAVAFTAFLTLVGRDIYIIASHIEEACKTDLDFGVGYQVKTATTAESFFDALTKNTLIVAPIFKALELPLEILGLDDQDLNFVIGAIQDQVQDQIVAPVQNQINNIF